MSENKDIFEGKYDLVNSENFDGFLGALGVGFVLRKVASTLKPMFQVIRHADDEYTFISKSTFKTSEFRFKLGEKFKETRMDGVVCDSVITRDGNKLIQEEESDPPAKIIREFNGDDLKIVCKTTDKKSNQEVEAIRTYKRKEDK